ncbi:MAG: 1-deoxy-D-xylulose-5-phosphate synthase, partial [Thermoguttaceae bacterium]|nr:1-deoxy-D-xylulose-5-phosphate synthase [Thermoguttaceae bacterium]
KMTICPRVGSFGQYLDSLRMNPFYTEMKADLKQMVQNIPVVGKGIRSKFHDLKMAFKACVSGGMLFEELGIRYIGPVDGHDIRQMQKFLRMARQFKCPVLLHVLTQKGHGFTPAEEDPASYHAPNPAMVQGVTLPECETKPDHSYTALASEKIRELMERDPHVVVITAAMCQGNKLELIRKDFPDRIFDVGICESHAVVLASGMAKAGLRPVVDIYSTFLQRAFDHIFQEVSLQNLPVTLLMDRAGLVGADGPTHHGAYDMAYLRPFPNLTITAPCDEYDLNGLLELAVTHTGPVTIRYSKTQAPKITGVERQPVRLGKCEILQAGTPGGGLILATGVQAAEALEAVRQRGDRSITVVNLRFLKPLDEETLLPLIRQSAWTLTVEEGCRIGGAGSAVLEMANDAQDLHPEDWPTSPRIIRLGIPDRFIQHATRAEQLAEVGLDASGILAAIEKLSG